MVAYPSLELDPQESSMSYEPMPTFGSLYEALAGLGIREFSLECLRGFLEQHRGHRL